MKTCEHVNARDAPQNASARVGMFASRLSLRFQLSKNNPFLKAWLGLKRIVPIISSDRLRGSLRSGDTIPLTCAVSPTFRYGAFLFVASALADANTLLHKTRYKSIAAVLDKM